MLSPKKEFHSGSKVSVGFLHTSLGDPKPDATRSSLLVWNLSLWFASSLAGGQERTPKSVADLLTSRWVREVFSRRCLHSHSHPVSVMEWSDSFSSVSVEFTLINSNIIWCNTNTQRKEIRFLIFWEL